MRSHRGRPVRPRAAAGTGSSSPGRGGHSTPSVHRSIGTRGEIPGYGETQAMTPEAEGVDQRPLEIQWPCVMGNVVQIAFRIRILQIDRRGDPAVIDREDR